MQTQFNTELRAQGFTPDEYTDDKTQQCFIGWSKETMQEGNKIYDYLIELRDSGVTNMYGAGEFIAKRYGVSDSEASDILLAWMDSFKQ